MCDRLKMKGRSKQEAKDQFQSRKLENASWFYPRDPQQQHEGWGQWKMTQQEFWAWEAPYFKSFFHISRRFNFFENVKKTEQLRAPFSSANTETKKMIYFFFWFFLTKILVTGWPKFTQFIASILPTNFIFWIFSNSDFFLFLFHIRNFDCIIQTKRGRVVGRAVGSKIDDPGSSPATANFLFSKIFKIFRICGRRRVFFLPNLLHLRKAKFFCQKYLCIFFLKSTTSITDRIDAMRRIYALRIFGKRTQITVRWGGTHESQVDCSPVHATVQRMKHRQRWSRQWPRHQGWSGRCQAKAVPHPDGICHSHPTHFALSKDRPVAACGRCWHQACSLSFY